MRETILKDIIEAMKAKDKEKLAVLRMVKGAMQLEEINVKHELNDVEMTQILSKQIKTRKDSITEFEKGGRNDLIEATQKEIDILSEYLPKQLSSEEIDVIIDDIFKKVNPTSPKDMGAIMKEATPLLKGKADMKEVSNKIKDRINSL